MSHRFTEINVKEGVPIKAWVDGVPFDYGAQEQLRQTARLPIIHKWVAVMPDVHVGKGATIGSVIPTKSAIIPAAVGVDLGCGMMAHKTSLFAKDLPDSLAEVRAAIEAAVPHGRSSSRSGSDKGSWSRIPKSTENAWKSLLPRFEAIVEKHPKIKQSNHVVHLGTLGTGNHFIELCLDEDQAVWVMLHSGSRGVGNRIGTYFINLAKEDMRTHWKNLPHRDLSYFNEGTEHFDDYVEAILWAQDFARINRELMMVNVMSALSHVLPPFTCEKSAVNCHHNYATRETHDGESIWVTRKGAVRAGKGELGIIPGSMGAKSFIVKGKGNPHSFETCSHGAGRVLSRTAAKRQFSVKDHEAATQGVECRKDEGVIDETPMAYKDIDAVINAQNDLIEVVHTLKQIVCVKG